MEFIGRIKNDIKLYESDIKIVLFGAGNGLDELLNILNDMNIRERVVCICDNDLKKQGNNVEGLRVNSLEYTSQHYGDAIYIVYNKFCIEICKQLLKNNIKKIHLIRS